MSSPTPPAFDDNRRYHSLDQLRAVMMFLGLVIHSAISFITAPSKVWPYKDASTSVLFDVLVYFIHVFRMPLFFLVAGFFTAYLYYRRGARQMFSNRMARLALPFAIFLPILIPLIRAGGIFSSHGGIHGGWERAVAFLATPSIWYEKRSTGHLWFVYYLILFCVILVVVMPLIERATGSWTVNAAARLGRFIHHPLGLLGAISITFLTLLPMQAAGLDTEPSFVVHPKILIAYGVFVAFGWVLYLNRDQLDGFGARAWTWLGAGALLSTAYLANTIINRGQYMIAGKLLAAAAMWTLIYGFLGLFVRYFDQPKPLGRYLADASYWAYLVHLPITLWVPGLMNGWNPPAVIKFSITLAAATLLPLATYYLFVRSTAIGALLNGKRYTRGLPDFGGPAPRPVAQENGLNISAAQTY